jgi:hypothetical protein
MSLAGIFDRPLQLSMRDGYATASNDSRLAGARLPSTIITEMHSGRRQGRANRLLTPTAAARRLSADLGHDIEGLLDGKEFKQTAYARP